jgi:hypothetical protein
MLKVPEQIARRGKWQRLTRLSALAFTFASLSACGSAGPWGMSRKYTPLDAEVEAAHGAKDFDPVMLERFFETWAGKPVSVFGVVQELSVDAGGQADLLLSVRGLQERNLCQSADESSCRVTVSDAEFAVVNARVNLLPEEKSGEHRLLRGALVRVIGPVAKAPHPQTGNTVLLGSYHRHWPAQYYVTTADREYMLR